jgi:hypothetical protein
VLRVARQRSVRRTDHSSRGVLSVMCLSVFKCKNNLYTYREETKDVETKKGRKKEGNGSLISKK